MIVTGKCNLATSAVGHELSQRSSVVHRCDVCSPTAATILQYRILLVLRRTLYTTLILFAVVQATTLAGY